ncbi:MAG: M48 family metallopeptidase [Saprospiraceae bacterium]|nr:M48 family metallopeptidase [Saprospiraceae bacterium]
MVSYLKIGNHDIPIKIIQEWRMSTRVALGKDYVILRIPKNIFGNQISKHLSWAEDWLHKVECKKPNTLLRYVNVTKYENGSVFIIGEKNFQLHIVKTETSVATIKLKENNRLFICFPNSPGMDEQKVIRHLLSRFFCRYFLPQLKERVHHFNAHYFNQEIKAVRMKYNKSNWGSCSRDKNLNFSVRLFLGPKELLDYVIVHELAHLLEMNHSPKFWKIVENIMPDYKKHEKLLKTNSHAYDF